MKTVFTYRAGTAWRRKIQLADSLVHLMGKLVFTPISPDHLIPVISQIIGQCRKTVFILKRCYATPNVRLLPCYLREYRCKS